MIAVGGIVAVADTSWWISGQKRGDFPGWLESVSTLALVVGAALAAIYAARTLSVERARDFERHEEEKRAQALLIYAVAQRDGYGRVFLRVRNGSSTVVTMLNATGKFGDLTAHWTRPVLEPRKKATTYFFDDTPDWGQNLGREWDRLNEPPIVNLSFRDAAGRYWMSVAGAPPIPLTDD